VAAASVRQVLDPAPPGELAAERVEHAPPASPGQELQPVALQPAVHRDRQPAAPFGGEVEADAERRLEAAAPRVLERAPRAEPPRIGNAVRRVAQLIAEPLAGALELGSDRRVQLGRRREAAPAAARGPKDGCEPAPPLRVGEELRAAAAGNERTAGEGRLVVLDEAAARREK